MTIKELPESIKDDTWILFEQAMSPDPAIAAQYAVKLVTHLRVSMKMIGETSHEKILISALNTARLALSQYAQDTKPGHEGESLQTVSECIEIIGPLIYDPDEKYCKRNKHAFTGILNNRT